MCRASKLLQNKRTAILILYFFFDIFNGFWNTLIKLFSLKQKIVSSSLQDRPNTKSYRHSFRIVGIQDRHCCVGHSFGGWCFFYGATPICSACTVYSFGGGVGIVVLANSRRQVLPGRPVPSLFKQGVSKFKIRLRVSQGFSYLIFHIYIP